ncbi:MAG: response regulator transcription factor [Clostridiaceae bacterium]|jgi:DNA-binding NarL/FixJ family response regulator|nr:response regulator transcription factor [Clostridiaceae bacterium]
MNVVVVDDDKLVGASLKTILEASGEVNVVGVGCSGQDAVSLYERHKPDVLLLDIRMSGMSGLDAAEKILSSDPAARILFLTTFSDDEYIIRALKMGSRGYLLKQNYESIVPSLKAVYNGQSVFGDDIVSRIPSMLQKSRKPDFSKYGISEKEAEIITLVADGMNNKEIAATLYLSEGTVRNYLSVILEKLQLRDRTQLTVFYYKNQ